MIELKNIKKKFGKKILFDGLSLNIESKKLTYIYGASGCGKTTLLNIIGLIEEYDDGEILYDGKEIKKKSEIRKMLQSKIGFVFQDFGLIENETVKNNLMLMYGIKKKDSHIINKALEKVGLEDFEDRMVYELSGGEQQRVAIAKLLIKNPEIILADEPTASLDDANKEIVLRYLKEFANNGKAVVIVSHDKDVLNYADCIIDLGVYK